MRKSVIFLIAVAGSAGIVVYAPRWIASQVQSQREAQFQQALHESRPQALPVCPNRGPELDEFLNLRGTERSARNGLWKPVCLKAGLPVGRVALMMSAREMFAACVAQRKWLPDRVQCVLDEPLRVFADEKAGRTWARREQEQVIWMTTQPLAWNDRLVGEERRIVLILMTLVVLAAGLGKLVSRTRYALVARDGCRGPGEPELPQLAELLLHWFLGKRCRSAPGDLSEEYVTKLEAGWSRNDADAWYRWQVLHSVAPLAARGAQLFLRRIAGARLLQRGD